MTDAFGAREQLARLLRELAKQPTEGVLPGDTEAGWRVPMHINTFAQELQIHANRFLNQATELLQEPGLFDRKLKSLLRKPLVSEAEREEIEAGRLAHCGAICDELSVKYRRAANTRDMLKRIAEEELPFALFLREFAFKTSYLESGSVGWYDSHFLQDRTLRLKYSSLLSPMPLLWVANPSEMIRLDSMLTYETSQEDQSFCLYMGDNWQTVIQDLIRSAAIIIVDNERMSAGVLAEIELLAENDRLNDSYFTHPELVKERLKLSSANKLTVDLAGDKRTSRVSPSLAALPATALWLEQDSRQEGEAFIAELRAELEGLPSQSGRIHEDVHLAFLYSILSAYMLLEDPDGMISTFDAIAFFLSSYEKPLLSRKHELAEVYSTYADRLFGAIKYRDIESQIERNTSAFTKINLDEEEKKNDSPVTASSELAPSAVFMRHLQELAGLSDKDERVKYLQVLLQQDSLDNRERSLVYGALGALNFERLYNAISKDADAGERKTFFLECINNYCKAISLAPDNALSYWNRGYAYELMGHLRYALDDYLAATRHAPMFAEAHLYQARVMEALGKVRQANESYRIAAQLAPNERGLARKFKAFQKRWSGKL